MLTECPIDSSTLFNIGSHKPLKRTMLFYKRAFCAQSNCQVPQNCISLHENLVTTTQDMTITNWYINDTVMMVKLC